MTIDSRKIKLPLRRREVLAAGGFAATLGLPIPFLNRLAPGILPIALAQSNGDPIASAHAAERPSLAILADKPLNMEPPPHFLDDEVTPAAKMFVRNNGQIPEISAEAAASWRLAIDGEVREPLDLSIGDLRRDFEIVTLRLHIECAGNGRRFMKPAPRGNQWSFGAVSCAEWTGVRLRDLLERAGVKASAVYTAHFGADPHLSGDTEKQAISRGLPIVKAVEPHTLVAFAMNGADIPLLNGHPLRLVAPGWPGSCSQKWLTRITLRDVVHDGQGMTGHSYRMPVHPVAPGTEVPEADMAIIESQPVKSLITAPQTGARVKAGEAVAIRGHAWAGDLEVDALDYSIDFGATWNAAALQRPANKYAWQRWTGEVRFPRPGYYEVWARARDENGRAQPPTPPGWNPRGYLNNMQHRIALFAL